MTVTSQATPNVRASSKRRKLEIMLALLIPTILFAPAVVYLLRPTFARLNYQPQQGDIVFQALPNGPLVNAIEGATGSPYSHCGIVGEEDGTWVVYEAFDGVSRKPLGAWLRRGRGGGFAVYRLKEPWQRKAPETIAAVRRQLGRKYDTRYQLGGSEVYCSELIYLAFQQATDERLGKTVRLGELKWQPFRQLIERIEGGPPPLDREIITPRDLARAEQLKLVYRFGI